MERTEIGIGNMKIDVVHPGENYSLNGLKNIKEYCLNSKGSKYYYYLRVQRLFKKMDNT